MNRFHKTALAALLAAASIGAAVAADAETPAGARPGKFDFNYPVAGDAAARPLQVFDDGARTYFQFRQGATVPAVFDAASNTLLKVQPEGQYHVVDGVARNYVLQIGLQQARVGNAALSVPPALAKTSANTVQPAQVALSSQLPMAAITGQGPSAGGPNGWTDNSYATPTKGDRIVWVETRTVAEEVWFAKGKAGLSPAAAAAVDRLAGMRGIERVEIVGSDDPSATDRLPESRAAAIRDAFVRRGVPVSRISTSVAKSAASERRAGKATLYAAQIRMVVSAEDSRATAQANVRNEIAARVRAGTLPAAEAQQMLAAGTAHAATAATEPSTWAIRIEDGSVRRTLERWQAEGGYRVMWEVQGEEPAVSGTTQLAGSYRTALKQLITGVQAAGYPIDAVVHPNRTVRIVSTAQ